MKHIITTGSVEELGAHYEALGNAVNRLGWRIVRIKVEIDTFHHQKMTIWDNAPWWQFWRSKKQVGTV